MSAATSSCPACAGSLPQGAAFCPGCGARTPTGIHRVTGEVVAVHGPSADEVGHRDRLQRALGDAWELRRVLGRGGFATVYAAWDVRLKRDVAVKTLRHDLVVSHAVLQRFRREAEAIAKLRHPHIVPIYSVGEGEGLAYFVMPLIEGESLAARLQREAPLDVAETCRILAEAGGALAAAHRAGIVHRDVKPENVMLEGPERRAVVMDFGIAKLADAVDGGEAEGGHGGGLTATGLLVGSPHYMSPEQATGERALDHRSDQYSLATVGFRMLTGRLPFEGDSLPALLFRRTVEEAPGARALRQDVPPALAAVLARALERDPARRFPSMDDFVAALSAATAAPAVSAPSRRAEPPPEERRLSARRELARWWRPALLVGALGLLAAVLLHGRTVPVAVMAVAAQEPAARAAGRAVLSDAGMPADAPTRLALVAHDSVFRFMQRALGSRDGERLAARDGTVWHWHTVRHDRDRDVRMAVAVAPDGRVVEFSGTDADTLGEGVRLDAAAARVAAEGVLERWGRWNAGRLRFVDGTSVLGRESVHRFRWAVAGDTVAGRGDAGGARREVQVVVTGDRVTGYRDGWALPADADASWWDGVGTAVRMAAVLLMVVAVGLAVAVGLRLGRQDDLQWGLAQRLSLAPALLVLLGVGVGLVEEQRVPMPGAASSWTDLVAGIGISALIGLGGLLIVAVVAESLAQRHRPATMAGVMDVVRGHVLVPEAAVAGVIGTAVALFMAGTDASVVAAVRGWADLPISGELPSALDLPAARWSPVVSMLLLPAMVVCLALPLLCAVLLLRHLRAPVPVALLAPALVVGAFSNFGVMAPQGLLVVAATLVFTLVLWRWGLLAMMVAMLVATLVPEGLYLLRGDTPVLAGVGVAHLALAAVPLLLAVAAWRRAR